MSEILQLIKGEESKGGELRVMVKFYFTNQKLLPTEIRLIERKEKVIEKRHGTEAKKMGIPHGAHRKGRFDTGKPIQFNNVSPIPSWEWLKENFKLRDVHYFFQKRSRGMKKWVIVVYFSNRGESHDFAEILATIERNLVHGANWGTADVWTNLKGPYTSITVNCKGRQPISSPPTP